MAEPGLPPPDESAAAPPRRLAAWIRYPLVAILGAALALAASYMLRKIGF